MPTLKTVQKVGIIVMCIAALAFIVSVLTPVSDKRPIVHTSELRPVVQELVERTCQLREKLSGKACSSEEKKERFEKTLSKTISKIISQGFYNYVDP